MKIFKLYLLISVFSLIFLAKAARASEGQIEVRSSVDDARCFAISVLMQDLNYNILMSCRDVVYPAEPEVLSYVIWATSLQDGTPIRLGPLNFGKVSFRTPKAFTNIFITKERNVNEKEPKGGVVMRGDVRSITFLETPFLLTPTERPTSFGEIIGTPVPTSFPTTRQARLSRFVAAGGLLALGGIFVIMLIIIFITRKR